MGSNVIGLRSGKWDILKFFLIFLVVLGHAIDFYLQSSETMRSFALVIYTFHIPVFIFVSGLFSKKTVEENRTEKLFGYLIMYLVTKLFPVLYRTIGGQKPGINLLVDSGIPWFMLALFWFNILAMILKKCSYKIVLPVSILVACVAGYFNEVNDFLVASRTIVYFPFFYMGYITDRKKLEQISENKIFKYISAAILVLFTVLIFSLGDQINWIRPLLSGRHPFSRLAYCSDYGFALRFLYYVAVALIGFAVIVLTPQSTRTGISEKLGQRTLAVYGFHFVAFYLIYDKFDSRPIIEKVFGEFSQWTVIPISVIVTLFFSIKFFNDIVLFFMNLPNKIIGKIKMNRYIAK